MINILQTEFFRLKKNVLFWSLLAVVVVLPLVSVLFNLLSVSLLNNIDMDVEINAWEYVKTLDITGAALSGLPNLSSDCALFALICTSIFLCKEFSGGTFRNMLLANRSRKEVYLSFWITSVTIGATYLVAEFLSTLAFNGAIFGFGSMNAANVVTACVVALALGLISVIFLQTMMCMFMFAARKLSVALVCPLVICMIVPSLLFSFVQIFAEFGEITESKMTWIPLYNLNLLDLTHIDGALIGKILLYVVPLAVLFGFLGWLTFRKADLK